MKIKSDLKTVDQILTRSIDSLYPSRKSVRDALLSGKRLTIYVGIDATADYVHLGHSTNYLLLGRLHQLGHQIIVLVGDFTAMIGDPTDKSAARVRLTKKQVLHNLKTFKDQIGKILNFKDKKNPIQFKFNSQWLAKLNFEDLTDLASNFSVQQMLERDMFEKRIKDNKPLYVHEFFYPLMQGYDSVAMDVDMEIGGTDQTFNMLAGRTLLKRYKNKEKFVVTTTLLTNPVTGEKMMSKSLGTGIGLNESSENMFGKVMALPDEGIIQTFTDCTRVSMEEIDAKQKALKRGENPRTIKMQLAAEIVTMYHGQKAAIAAQEKFVKQFSNKELPDEIREVSLAAGKYATTDLLVKLSLAASKSEARRLLEQNGVKVNQKTFTDSVMDIGKKNNLIIQVGKRKFVKIK
ncbi:tyrosine--tRNA ligase [bacterium]|nr:MAG: tyrosine--tRNA ligase [bacterium]